MIYKNNGRYLAWSVKQRIEEREGFESWRWLDELDTDEPEEPLRERKGLPSIVFPDEEDLLRKIQQQEKKKQEKKKKKTKKKEKQEGDGRGAGDACPYCGDGGVHDCRGRSKVHGWEKGAPPPPAADGARDDEDEAEESLLSVQLVRRALLIPELGWAAVLRRERLARAYRAWGREYAAFLRRAYDEAEEDAFRARPWDRPLKREAAIAHHMVDGLDRLRGEVRATVYKDWDELMDIRELENARRRAGGPRTCAEAVARSRTIRATLRRHDDELGTGSEIIADRALEILGLRKAADALRDEWDAWKDKLVYPRVRARMSGMEAFGHTTEAVERRREWEETHAREQPRADGLGWLAAKKYFVPRRLAEAAVDEERARAYEEMMEARRQERKWRDEVRQQCGPGDFVWELDVDPPCLRCAAKGLHCSLVDRRRQRRGGAARCSRCVRAGCGWCVQLEEQARFEIYICGVPEVDPAFISSYDDTYVNDTYYEKCPRFWSEAAAAEELGEYERPARWITTWPTEKFPVRSMARGIRLAGEADDGRLWVAFVREPGLDEAALRELAEEMLEKAPERVVPGLIRGESCGRGKETPTGRGSANVFSSSPSPPSSPSPSSSSACCSFYTPPSSPSSSAPRPSSVSSRSSYSRLFRAPPCSFSSPSLSPDASGHLFQDWHHDHLKGHAGRSGHPASLPAWNRVGNRAEYQIMTTHQEYFTQLKKERRRLEAKKRGIMMAADRRAQLGWGWVFRARF